MTTRSTVRCAILLCMSSALAAPRGLVVVLPGYESAILPLAARSPEARADLAQDKILVLDIGLDPFLDGVGDMRNDLDGGA